MAAFPILRLDLRQVTLIYGFISKIWFTPELVPGGYFRLEAGLERNLPKPGMSLAFLKWRSITGALVSFTTKSKWSIMVMILLSGLKC